MPEKHLIDTLIFIFCATSAQKNLFIFPRAFGVRMGARPLSKISGSAPGKKERSSQAGRGQGREGGQEGVREAGRERGRAGREGGQAGRERGRQAGREGGQAGRQGDGGHADPVVLNTFHLVLTYSTREWDTTLL